MRGTTEQWKAVAGTAGYVEVSDLGRVRSWTYWGKTLKKPRPLPSRRIRGYKAVSFKRNGQSSGFLIHKLVLEAFVGPAPEGHNVHYISGNKDNTALVNLKYVTFSKNVLIARDELEDGLPNQVIDRKMAERIIRELARGNATQIEIAQRLGVTPNIVCNIWLGNSWKDLHRPYPVGTRYNDWRKLQVGD